MKNVSQHWAACNWTVDLVRGEEGAGVCVGLLDGLACVLKAFSQVSGIDLGKAGTVGMMSHTSDCPTISNGGRE